jgi:microcystin-dependent protein
MSKIYGIKNGIFFNVRIHLLILFLFLTVNLKSQSYVGEIRIFAGNFAPSGWMFCDGSLISISEHEVLFQLIGTTYGGDGETTFALPDLKGRVPLHMGNGFIIGQSGGSERETLTIAQIPSHTHGINYNDAKGDHTDATDRVPARNAAGMLMYGNPEGDMHGSTIEVLGGGQSHNNMQPYQVLNYIISLYGIFPSMSKSETEAEFYLHADGTISEYMDKATDPFLGEIKIFAFNFAPKGWAQCNGQILPINLNQALFSLLGTQFGGDGRTNFALPDLRGRTPVGYGQTSGATWNMGHKPGVSTHTLDLSEIPPHSHALRYSKEPGNASQSAGNRLSGNSTGIPSWSPEISGNITRDISMTGGSQPHNNMQPYLTLNFAIAMQGIFPSRNKDVPEKGSEPFVGEVAIMAFNFAPTGYALCQGQTVLISQNTALFALLGTNYGGDGKTNFLLPDLMGRVALHRGQGTGLSNYSIGEKGGEEYVTLTLNELPAHNHTLNASLVADSDAFASGTFSLHDGAYAGSATEMFLNEKVILQAGAGFPHNNLMPSLGINFSIALQGIFPSRP